MHHLTRRLFGPLQGCLSVVKLCALPRNFLVTPTDVEMLPDAYTLLVIEFSNLPVVRHRCSLGLDRVQTWVKSPRPRAVLNICANCLGYQGYCTPIIRAPLDPVYGGHRSYLGAPSSVQSQHDIARPRKRCVRLVSRFAHLFFLLAAVAHAKGTFTLIPLLYQ